MPKISILGTATPPPYCDCTMDEPKPHYHWAVFVDSSGVPPKSSLSSLCCLNQDDANDDDFSAAAVLDLHGKRLRRRPAIQVSFTAQELPVQIIVAKPGSPQSKIWSKRNGLVSAVEKALRPARSENTSQDEWLDAVILALMEVDLIERFNQDNFRNYARMQLGPASLPDQQKEPDVVKEVDYVEARRAGLDKPDSEFVRVQVGGGR